MAKPDNTQWNWWAGRNEEWLNIGPCSTRDDIIAEAKSDIGEGEGDFHIIEGRMHSLTMSADSLLDWFVNNLCDSNQYSTEHDSPDWEATGDQQREATAELQAALDVWMDKWRHTFTAPNMFAVTRNEACISNTVDPDMLPGGHDNPREPFNED